MNHLLVDIHTERLSLEKVKNVFDEIVVLLNLKVLKKESYVFDNGGFTLFFLLAESHLSAHYRIEDNYLALDVYSCRDLSFYISDLEEILTQLGNVNIKMLERNMS
jgi:S-adenosylmethionine decarboxylase